MVFEKGNKMGKKLAPAPKQEIPIVEEARAQVSKEDQQAEALAEVPKSISSEKEEVNLSLDSIMPYILDDDGNLNRKRTHEAIEAYKNEQLNLEFAKKGFEEEGKKLKKQNELIRAKAMELGNKVKKQNLEIARLEETIEDLEKQLARLLNKEGN